MKYLLWGVIILAIIFVAVKKFKDLKKGKYCSCGCSECSKKCKEFKE